MNKLHVYYNNKMNLLAFKNLSKIEANLFFSIIARIKEKKTEKVTLYFSEIAEFLDRNYTIEELREIVLKGIGKIVQTTLKWENNDGIRFFTLFKDFFIPHNEHYLIISVNEPFIFILNGFKNGQFTMFELAEFSSLSSKYTQTLYRLLKQFKSVGFKAIKWNDFIEIMDIPNTYPMGMIDKRILKPAIEELTKPRIIFLQEKSCFKKLFYKKIRSSKKGRPVERIEFYFTAEKKTKEMEKEHDMYLEMVIRNNRKEEIIRKLKNTVKATKINSVNKINPFTGRVITGFEKYLYESLSFKNKFGEYDTLKIQNITQNEYGKIVVDFKNVDDNYNTKMEYDSLEHFDKVFNKHRM